MANSYQDEIIENYEHLREQREWSAEQMVAHLEPLDAALAAEYRSRYVTDKAAPKGRKAPQKSEG